MSIFDSIQNLIGGAVDSAQGVVGDTVGGMADSQVVQDLREQATSITEGGAEALGSVTEQGQTAVDDITQNLGL